MINYATGFYANEPVIDHITGFQAMVLENLFGWINEQNGKRLITEIVLLIGRKSGKSFLCGLLEILLMLTGNKFEQNGLGAKTRDIARIVKTETEQLIKLSPYINDFFKIQRDKIECKINESYMKTVSSQANNANGLLLISYIVDEVANMENHDLIGALKLSQMSTKQRLGVHISTAYNLEVNAMKDLCDLHKKVLDGLVDDIHSFGLIFELDEGDDYMDEENWIKASPFQITIEDGIEFMRGEFAKGLEVEEKMKEFRIKLLNQWISDYRTESYVPIEEFKKCKLEKPFDWYGKEVFGGLDLSMTNDNTSFSMFTYDYNTGKFYSKTWAFIPKNRIYEKTKKEKVKYEEMINKGYCFACGENTIDYSFIENFILGLEDKYGVSIKAIGYDRYNCLSMANKLENEGLEMIEIKQHSSVLHPATKKLKEKILNYEFRYDENTLLEINFSNARESKDTNLNGYVNKKKSNGKVDMVVSNINAMALWTKELDGEDDTPGAFIL